VNDEEFRGGEIYDNVYLLAVDASGYSTIVKSNPRDRVGHAFDLLREDIGERVRSTAVETGCRRAHLWFWRGDGGLFLIHDGNESVARDVALSAAWKILVEDLTLLRNKLRGTELKGELRLRIAVHKGPLRYMDSGYNGSIHSPDINFVTHLEETTPPDCIAVSDEVYQAAGDHSAAYTHVGEFEERRVYLTTATGDSYDARRAWLAEQGLAGGVPILGYVQRPSQLEKSRMVDSARAEILDLGTALRTSANYLITTERPAWYRDAVLNFLRRGGRYRCVMLDPACETARIISDYRQEELGVKIRTTVQKLSKFKDQHGSDAAGLQAYLCDSFPGFSALAVDPHTTDPIVLFSPYLMSMKPLDLHVPNGDTPHYVVSGRSGQLQREISALLNSITTGDMEQVL
jgi:class 3 adenylate cyclase